MRSCRFQKKRRTSRPRKPRSKAMRTKRSRQRQASRKASRRRRRTRTKYSRRQYGSSRDESRKAEDAEKARILKIMNRYIIPAGSTSVCSDCNSMECEVKGMYGTETLTSNKFSRKGAGYIATENCTRRNSCGFLNKCKYNPFLNKCENREQREWNTRATSPLTQSGLLPEHVTNAQKAGDTQKTKMDKRLTEHAQEKRREQEEKRTEPGRR